MGRKREDWETRPLGHPVGKWAELDEWVETVNEVLGTHDALVAEAAEVLEDVA